MKRKRVNPTPTATVRGLVDAINRGDVDSALALYEADGVLIAQPGSVAKGRAALRDALAAFAALRPTLTSDGEAVIESDDIALYCGKWQLTGTDPAGNNVRMQGRSSDVLRRQPDGTWLIAIDNPWGGEILS